MIKLVCVAVAVLVPILFIAAMAGIAASAASGANSSDCTVAGASSVGMAGYQPDQMTNAATIVAVGSQLNVPEQGWVVAIAAALQESGLRNLDHGDRDSLGLFQQRPSQGWGTPAQVMDPTYAATQFYRHLLAVPGWEQMNVNDAAQAVQHSGTPEAYGPHEQAARAIVRAVQHATCTSDPGTAGTVGAGDCTHIQAPNPVALAAVNYACGQRGIPYLWGGNGASDGGFDCSGLTTAAYAAAGISLPRTAQTQYDRGPLLPAGAPLEPGDLVFYGSGPTTVTHVGIAVSTNTIIDAPHTGTVVRIDPVGHYLAASRPTLAALS
jgi:cell wall-associated NlpC family hydrolase